MKFDISSIRTCSIKMSQRSSSIVNAILTNCTLVVRGPEQNSHDALIISTGANVLEQLQYSKTGV